MQLNGIDRSVQTGPGTLVTVDAVYVLTLECVWEQEKEGGS